MMGRSSEFEFWQETLPSDHHHRNQLHGYNSCDEIVMNGDSSQLWKVANSRHENPYLQPHNSDNYCYMSPKSRCKATVDSRNELVEMIKDMPESWYDLSFKDMVTDQDEDNTEELQETKEPIIERKVQNKTTYTIPQRNNNNKKNMASRHISRSESMESEVFLLKLFVPVSFSSSKKSRRRKVSEFIPRPPSSSSKGYEKQQGARNNWWKTMFISMKDDRNTTKIKRSTSDVTNNRTSLLRGSSLSCQRSLSEKKFEARENQGCLFWIARGHKISN